MDTPPPAAPEPNPQPTPEPSPVPVPTPTPPAPENPGEKQWRVILYVSGLAGLLLPSCGNIIAPLVIWLIKKQDIPALESEGRKVLNFQISATIYIIVSSIIGALTCVLIFLPLAVVIWWLVYTIIGAVKASNNEPFEFPLTIKLL